MLLHILRGVLFLLIVVIGMSYAESEVFGEIKPYTIFLTSVGLALAAVAADSLVPRKSLAALAGVFFGLVVGMLITFGISLVLNLFGDVYPSLRSASVLPTLKLLVGVIVCYFCVSLILQTKDDIRFVIPYVEFAKHTKGQHALILDTSVIIDGRITDICETRIVDQQILVPRFVLHELQAVADSSDKLKRNRGRRGLDVLNKLQSSQKIEVQIYDGGLTKAENAEPVDQKLLSLAKKLNGRVVTNDYNLNKVAQVRGVEVININDLANALKPVVLPGEHLEIKIIRPGQEPGQGVGYLDDGTMVVVEAARERIGETLPISVTSALQTSAGRMVFGRVEDSAGEHRPERPDIRRPRGDAPAAV